jgi:hypothetical protein
LLMKKLLIFCSFLSLSACWSYDPTIIQGKVIDKATNLPVPDIAVVVHKREGFKLPTRDIVANTQTDSLGQYHFTLDFKPNKNFTLQTLENQQYRSSEENGFNLEEFNQIDLFIMAK